MFVRLANENLPIPEYILIPEYSQTNAPQIWSSRALQGDTYRFELIERFIKVRNSLMYFLAFI